MQKQRLDFSELVTAIQNNKEAKANSILKEVMPRLKDYLQVTMNAGEHDAEECIHNAFLSVYEQILKGNIKKEKYIFSYLISACRNEYIAYAKSQHRFESTPIEDSTEHLVTPAKQVENLLDEDKQRILEECLNNLEEKNRRFIRYFIDKPDATTKEASKFFDLSGANVRTKKSRIISRLHHCVKRKWDRDT